MNAPHDELLLVFTSLPSQEAASALARELLQRQLVACAQIQPIDSLYHWQGELREEREWRLLLKTRSALYGELQALVLDLHPYELPALMALPVAQAAPAFEAWVRGQTAQPQA